MSQQESTREKPKRKVKQTVKMQTRSNCKALVATLTKHPASVLLSEELNANPDIDLSLQELKQVIVSKDASKINSLTTLKVVVDKLFAQSKKNIKTMHL